MASDQDIIQLIGDNIRLRRNNIGMSQQELADNSDVAKSTIQRIEKGELNPTVVVLLKISNGLNIELTALLGNISNIEK